MHHRVKPLITLLLLVEVAGVTVGIAPALAAVVRVAFNLSQVPLLPFRLTQLPLALAVAMR
jgi:hypothetical protein